jgi:hypothetical protein
VTQRDSVATMFRGEAAPGRENEETTPGRGNEETTLVALTQILLGQKMNKTHVVDSTAINEW